MADINCTFSNVSAAEVRAADWAIAEWNQNHNTQVANANELVEAIIINEYLPVWLAKEAAATQSGVAAALWKEATDEQRAAALAALNG